MKDSEIQNYITHTIEKHNNESDATQSEVTQNVLAQLKLIKKAIIVMGKTIHDIDIAFQLEHQMEQNFWNIRKNFQIQELLMTGMNWNRMNIIQR